MKFGFNLHVGSKWKASFQNDVFKTKCSHCPTHRLLTWEQRAENTKCEDVSTAETNTLDIIRETRSCRLLWYVGKSLFKWSWSTGQSYSKSFLLFLSSRLQQNWNNDSELICSFLHLCIFDEAHSYCKYQAVPYIMCSKINHLFSINKTKVIPNLSKPLIRQ